MMQKHRSVIFILNVLVLAFQVIAQNSAQAPLQSTDNTEVTSHRVAIIGAGAGGSSAAYYLSKFHNELSNGQPIEIEVFESNSYIGGRTTTINALDDPRYPTELGGSIFVKVNHILYNLSQEFELSAREKIYETTGAVDNVGIWDGTSFLFSIANDDSNEGGWRGIFKDYWDIAKLLWKYGLSPIRTKNAKDAVVGSFLKLYDEYFPISSLTHFTTAVGLSEYTGIDGGTALSKHGVSEQFAREIVQSSTRVNYAQNLNNIHGLETMVCMAIEGAMSIDGGNWQIFSEAMKRSGAKLNLNTTVTDIVKTSQGTYQLQSKSKSTAELENEVSEYDTVILAAPYQFSNITFTPPLDSESYPEEIDYVTLHVTLFTSPYRPSPAYFGVDSQDQVPDSILTTLPSSSSSSSSSDNTNTESNNTPRGAEAVGPTRFWSLSTLRTLNPMTDSFSSTTDDHDRDLVTTSRLYPDSTSPRAQKQYLYKIFSPTPVTASFLSEIFGWNHDHHHHHDNITDTDSDSEPDSDSITTLPSTQVPWSYTKIWHSYPYLPPRTTFPPILLDSPYPEQTARFNAQAKLGGVGGGAKWTDAHGVFYTSGIEPFISTMETSALMGRNVAKIIVDGIGMKENKKKKKEKKKVTNTPPREEWMSNGARV